MSLPADIANPKQPQQSARGVSATNLTGEAHTMRQLTIRLILAAAAACAAYGAQTDLLTAEVPFPFFVSGAQLPAGSYSVRIIRSPNEIVLRNDYTKRQTVSLFNSAYVPNAITEAGKAKLRFECEDGQCVLVNLWPGGALGMQLPTPKLRKDSNSRGARGEITVVETDLSRY